jgi:hypothetical protein
MLVLAAATRHPPREPSIISVVSAVGVNGNAGENEGVKNLKPDFDL